MQITTGSQPRSPGGRQSGTSMMARRSDYIIVDDGADTRAYRLPNTGASLDGDDRRTAGRQDPRSLDGDRRERIRRALDRMHATPDEIWRIAAAAGRDAR